MYVGIRGNLLSVQKRQKAIPCVSAEHIGDATRDLFVTVASSFCWCTTQSILNNKPDHPFSHSDIFIRFVRGAREE